MIKSTSVYCVGIGGIGLSALARLLHRRGVMVQGSDASENEATRRLRRLGIPLQIGAPKKRLPRGVDLLIFSPAVPATHPLRRYAAVHRIQTLSYPQALWLEIEDKKVIAVAGTHGKTTVTSLIGWILTTAKKDPTIVVGAFMNNGNTNARLGRGTYAVIEADEFARSFHQLHPDIAVINNVDHDHFDTYPTLASFHDSFKRFAAGRRNGGALILNADDPFTKHLGNSGVTKFGLAAARYRPTHIRETISGTQFTIGHVRFVSPLFGLHNVRNVAAATAAAAACGVSLAQSARAVATFRGTWRRFEKIGSYRGMVTVSDYGHHPTEIDATIAAARQRFPGRPLVVVFQPHQHNRTRHLTNQFAHSLTSVDVAIITEVFKVAGRVRATERGVSAKGIADQCQAPVVIWAPRLTDVAHTLKQLKLSRGVLLFVGAGSIDAFARALIKKPHS